MSFKKNAYKSPLKHHVSFSFYYISFAITGDDHQSIFI